MTNQAARTSTTSVNDIWPHSRAELARYRMHNGRVATATRAVVPSFVLHQEVVQRDLRRCVVHSRMVLGECDSSSSLNLAAILVSLVGK